jgi:hypothetical protein
MGTTRLCNNAGITCTSQSKPREGECEGMPTDLGEATFVRHLLRLCWERENPEQEAALMSARTTITVQRDG